MTDNALIVQHQIKTPYVLVHFFAWDIAKLKLRAVRSSRQTAKITQCEKFAVIIISMIRTHVMLVLNNTHRRHVVIVIKILYTCIIPNHKKMFTP